MTKRPVVYCPKCGTLNYSTATKCKDCDHKLPTDQVSWLELIGILALILLGPYLLVSIIPRNTRNQPTPTPRPRSQLQNDYDLEAEIAAEQAIEAIASTAQADIMNQKIETVVAESTADALHYTPIYELDDCPHWLSAADHIGQDTCIYGNVTSTYDSGSAFFINFSISDTSFYAVSFDWVWDDLQNDCVIVYGTVERYQGRPQIVIEDLDQLRSCYQ